MYWCVSDIFEEQRSVDINAKRPPFHNGFGLQTMQGLKKPAFRALQLIAGFPNATFIANRTLNHPEAKQAGFVGAYAGVRWQDEAMVNVTVLVSCWSPTLLVTGDSVVALEIPVPKAINAVHENSTDCTANVARIPDPKAMWESMGSPRQLSDGQLTLLEQASELAPVAIPCIIDGTGSVNTARIVLSVAVQSVAAVSIQISNGLFY